MSRLLFILAFWTFFSCRTKDTNKAVISVSSERQTAIRDTVRRERFSAPIEYDQFQVATFSGKANNINYSSNRTASRFRSAINLSIEKFGANFAGHYNLARWGCGTACINGAITDLTTGRVYDLPPATLDYEFRRDSRLLVINPPDTTGYYDYCSYCEPELWVWDEGKKKFEKQK